MTATAELSQLRTVTLAQLDAVRLQDRMDTKFVLPVNRLPEVISHIMDSYSCLEIGGNRSFAYQSVYYDDPHFSLYYDHHRGRLNRFKVRVRTYMDSGLIFFEVKSKTNKARTIKSRIPLRPGEDPFTNEAVQVLESAYKMQAMGLRPVLRVDYSRITLVNNDFTERVTIDTGLKFVKGELVIDRSGLVVAEVKQEKAHGSKFSSLMKKWHVRQISLSKYCNGVISLYPGIKYNNFKPNTIQFRKIEYAAATRPVAG